MNSFSQRKWVKLAALEVPYILKLVINHAYPKPYIIQKLLLEVLARSGFGRFPKFFLGTLFSSWAISLAELGRSIWMILSLNWLLLSVFVGK